MCMVGEEGRSCCCGLKTDVFQMVCEQACVVVMEHAINFTPLFRLFCQMSSLKHCNYKALGYELMVHNSANAEENDEHPLGCAPSLVWEMLGSFAVNTVNWSLCHNCRTKSCHQ